MTRDGIVFTFLLTLAAPAHAQISSEPSLSEEPSSPAETSPTVESASSDTNATEHGFVTRLLFEAAAARLRYQYAATYEGVGNGRALYVDSKRTTTAPAFGARFELGYSLKKSPTFAFYPRGGLSLTRILESDIVVTQGDKPLVLSPLRYQGAATVGAELQLLRRSLGMALDLGLAWSHLGITNRSSPNFRVEHNTTFGAVIRGSALYRFPESSPWGGGLLGFADASAYPGGYSSGLVWSTRLGAALFIEWDGGRKQ